MTKRSLNGSGKAVRALSSDEEAESHSTAAALE